MFEVGKFYSHDNGRQIAIVGEVETYAWGKMLVVEEVDKTGHGISCAELGSIDHPEESGWIEIGKEEFLSNFKEKECCECKKTIKTTDHFISTFKGPAHHKCYREILKAREAQRYAQSFKATLH